MCRDYAHLAIALCRCMNIPARYCTGYLGDHGTPIDLLCYERDTLRVQMQRRFEAGDNYFETLRRQWLAGTRRVFHELPSLQW